MKLWDKYSSELASAPCEIRPCLPWFSVGSHFPFSLLLFVVSLVVKDATWGKWVF